MPKFRHRITGRVQDVDEADAHRYETSRWARISDEPQAVQLRVPDGTVAEVLEWAGTDPDRRAAALEAEKVGKNRKGVIEGLSV